MCFGYESYRTHIPTETDYSPDWTIENTGPQSIPENRQELCTTEEHDR